MSAHDEFDLRLTDLFDELAAARTPDYLDEVRATARRSRQRPRWSFPARWLPVDVAIAPPMALGRLAWLLIVIGILGALAVAAVVGSRPRLPAPFGPAANGLVVVDDGSHIAVVEPDGSARRVLTSGTGIDTHPSFSLDGRRIAFLRRSGGIRSLVVTATDGQNPQILASPAAREGAIHQEAAAWSPDGTRLAVLVPGDPEPHDEIWIVRADGTGRSTFLPPSLLTAAGPAWAPDGKRIAFLGGRAREAGDHLYVAGLDGTGLLQLSNRASSGATGYLQLPRWSPDGTRIAVHYGDSDRLDRDILVLATDHLDEQVIAGTPLDEAEPAWSPDGKELAYVRSTAVGTRRFEVAIVDLATRETTILSPAGVLSDTLAWSPDGTRIGALHCPTDTGCELWLLDISGTREPVAVQVGTKDYSQSDDRAYWSWQRLAP